VLPCRPKLLYTIPIHNNPAGTASLLLLGGSNLCCPNAAGVVQHCGFLSLGCGFHVDAVVRQGSHNSTLHN
jgi:hypothetical protein